MPQETVISFKSFYIIEFFKRIKSISKQELPEDKYLLFSELVDHLHKQDDIVVGLEHLAREQGTSELSIFLFDIIDRISDYPPSLIYDSLDEMAVDFVNTIGLMMQEQECTNAIKKLNSKFSEQDADVEEELNYEQFVEKEFFDRLRTKLENNFDTDQAEKLWRVTDLITKNPQLPQSENIPEALTGLTENLQSVFSRRLDKAADFRISMKEIKQKIETVYENLIQLNTENAALIDLTLENGKITLPAEIAQPKYEKEEIPEKPTTIESLLSDYFQTEVDEYVHELKNDIDRLKANPNDVNLLKQFERRFQSFKEVSMIHGFGIIEDFCAELINMFAKFKKKKYKFNTDAFSNFNQVFALLESADKLKGVEKNTDLQNWLQEMENKLAQKEADSEEEPQSETKEETTEDEQIAFNDFEKLYSIFRDLALGIMPVLEKQLGTKKDLEKGRANFSKILQAAQLLKNQTIVSVLSDFGHGIDRWQEIKSKNLKNAAKDLLSLYSGFLNSITPESNQEEWRQKLSEFNKTYFGESELISFDETDRLLLILMEIEKNNLSRYPTVLSEIFENNNLTEKKLQEDHFRHVLSNLKFIKAKKEILDFPHFFLNVLDMQVEKDVYANITESYSQIIESIIKEGTNTDIGSIVIKTESLLISKKDIKPGDETEEDLEVIFKQEADNYLEKIDEALSTLENNILDKEKFGVIERNVHSLKSSARLMGYDSVAQLAAPLESVCELFFSTNIEATAENLSVIKDAIQYLHTGVEGKSSDTSEVIKQLSEIEDSFDIIEEDKKSETETIQVIEEKQPTAEKESDEDEDLLEIFKEESTEFIKIVEEANDVLETDLGNVDALHQQEYASHSLKSAAKMLGFREIGQIADGIESIAESLYKGELLNSSSINALSKRAILVIKDLTEGKKYNPSDIADLLRDLDIEQLKIRQEKGEEEDQIQPQTKRPAAELDAMTELFLKEAWELLELINRDMVKLEKSQTDKDLLDDLSRNLHTLKGSAQMLSLEKIGTLAHQIEDFFEYLKTSEYVLPAEDMDLIFSAIDEIQNLMESIKSGKGETSTKYASIESAIETKLMQLKPGSIKLEKIEKKSEPKIVEVERTPVIPKEQDQVIKINTTDLDNLVNMAAELVINKTQLANYLEKLKSLGENIDKDKKLLKSTDITLEGYIEKRNYEKKSDIKEKGDELLDEFSDDEFDRFGELHTVSKDFKQVLDTITTVSTEFNSLAQNFEQSIGRISNLTKLLHDDILQVRMVPIENLFNRFPRAVRDLSHKQGKQVSMLVEGEKTEMDRAMIESLSDPVMHIIRNAIDHGIELPDQRINNGKSADGIILLKAHQDKNQIIIEIQDDGRGIEIEKVKENIFKRRLATKEEIDKMSRGEIFDFIFHTGFSTREVASEVSGRGIGLDVVAGKIQKLKGDIRVSSTEGKGAIFSIRVPLTLIISQAMLIEVSNELFAVPLVPVEETIQFEDSEIIKQGEKEFLAIRGNLIPLAHLSNLLNFGEKDSSKKPESRTAIIIQETGAQYGLIVDKVLRREEIVIKSLGENLNNVTYISGGTILGDGSVALILDISAIVRKIEVDIFGADRDFSSIDKARKLIVEKKEQKAQMEQQLDSLSQTDEKNKNIFAKKITDRQPSALIVDDSISVRKFVASVLERNNYITVLANDGLEALSKLEKGSFDIIVTDLEMPKMHGFEMIQEIRNQKKYKNLPIVILTGRAGQKHREMGVKLGANAFLVKPFKEADLLKTLEQFIEC